MIRYKYTILLGIFIKTNNLAMIGIFRKKDKNKLNDVFASDQLISLSLKLIGENREKVIEHFGEKADLIEKKEGNGIVIIHVFLKNNCAYGVYIENNQVYKVVVFLNHKPSKQDKLNLNIFQSANKERYGLYGMKDNEVKRHVIGCEGHGL